MTAKSRTLFVNLPVADVARSREFFEALGFEFDERYCDERALCLILEKDASFVMLLERGFFQTFTKKGPVDTSRATEAILALGCRDEGEMDAITEKALALGAVEAMPPVDHGFMKYRTFYDLDGHHWELLAFREEAEA